MPLARVWRCVASLIGGSALLVNGLALAPGVASGATTSYYFAIANGNWNAATGSGVWQTCANAAESTGCTTVAVTAPTSAANVVTVNSGVTIHVASAVTADQVVIAASGHLVVDPGFTLALSNGAGTDLTVDGTAVVSGTLSYPSGSAIDVSGSLSTLSGGAIAGGSAASVVTVKTGGSLTIASGSSYAVTGSGAATLNVNAGGAATVNGPLSGIPTMTVNGTLTASANMMLTGAVSSQVKIGGAFTVTSATLTATRGNAGFVVEVDSGGNLALTGTSTASIGTVATARLDLLTGGTLDIGPGAVAGGAGIVQVSSGATLKVGSADGIANSTTVGSIRTAGTDSYNPGANYEYKGSAVQVTGSALPVTALTGTVKITNPAGVTPTNNILVNAPGKVQVAAGGSLALPAAGPGSLVSGTGTFQLDSGGTLQIGSAAGLASTGATGNVQTTTRSYSTAANYSYNGTAAQPTGAGLPATVNSINLGDAAGVSLTNPVTLTNGGAVAAGAFNIGPNKVIVSGSAALAVTSGGSISRTTGYVIGNLKKVVGTGGPTVPFEIGTAGAYTPVTITFNGVTTAGTLAARATSNDHPSLASSALNPAKSLNSYYTLKSVGTVFGSYDATFAFPGTFGTGDAQLDTGTNPTALFAGRFGGATWAYPALGIRTATSTQITGQTAFGDFVLAEAGTGNPAPSISLTSPSAGTVFSVEKINAMASYGAGVSQVDFLVDGALLATDTTAPYGVDWDTSTSPDGPHMVAARLITADGQVVVSAAVAVSVANALPADARVDSDYQAGRLSVDDFARYGVYALGAPYALPQRYWSNTPPSDGTTKLYHFLKSWNTLAQATRNEITAFIAQPLRGPMYSAVIDTSSPRPALETSAAIPGISSFSCLPVVFVTLPLVGGAGYCTVETDDFTIQFFENGTGLFGSSTLCGGGNSCPADSPPASVITLAAGLEEAFKVYRDTLGYPTPWGGKVPVQIWAIGGGFTPPTGIKSLAPVINLPASLLAGQASYLAHHELFHVFQNNYLHTFAVLAGQVPGVDGPEWWMEATADWAAGYVARSLSLEGSEPDSKLYAQRLPEFLGRPDEKLSVFENAIACQFGVGPCGQRQYGAFVFAEYLAERFGQDTIRNVWEKLALDGSLGHQLVEPALEQVVDLGDVFPSFAAANYLLDYQDADGGTYDVFANWRLLFLDHGALTGGSTNPDSPSRPKRDRHTMFVGQTIGPVPVSISADGGAAYVELVPPDFGGGAGHIQLQVASATPWLSLRVMSLTYSANGTSPDHVCFSTPMDLDSTGSGTFIIPVGDCAYIALIFAGTHSDPDVVIPFTWTAQLVGPISCTASAVGPDVLGGSIASVVSGPVPPFPVNPQSPQGYVYQPAASPAVPVMTFIRNAYPSGFDPTTFAGTPNNGQRWGLAPTVNNDFDRTTARWAWDLGPSPAKLCSVVISTFGSPLVGMSLEASDDGATWHQVVSSEVITANVLPQSFSSWSQVGILPNQNLHRYWSLVYDVTLPGGGFDGFQYFGGVTFTSFSLYALAP